MNSKSVFILGRQPALGIAELESLFGGDHVIPVPTSSNAVAAIVDIDPSQINFNRIGGSIKLAKLLTELPGTDFRRNVDYINKTILEHLQYIPEGKIKFGISVFGIRTTVNDINRATLRIKKTIKSAGRSIRVVPNTELALNSAQVRSNQLTSPVGMELIQIANGGKTILAQTVSEQDIDAYAARDQGRPKRDSKVGMLPPKLAQIIINLAKPEKDSTVLDPFCGTGVILQEAALMGLGVYGADLEPRMIEYTNENLKWLEGKTGKKIQAATEIGDATNLEWKEVNFDSIACETYLGRPFSSIPEQTVLQEVIQDVNLIHKRFLQNVAKHTEPGFRMCIAVPAWHTINSVKHLKVLDNLEDLGYNRLEFVHVDNDDLIYHREGQIVGRELVVLTRI